MTSKSTAERHAREARNYARALVNVAPAWLAAMHDSLADGYSRNTSANGEPGGGGKGSHGDPTASAGVNRADGPLSEALTQVETGLAEFAGLGKQLLNIMGKHPVHYQHESTMKDERCSGAIDATCKRVRSEHHDPNTGSLIDDKLCDDCYADACPSCVKRKADSRRGGKCDACARQEQRKAKAA